MLLLILTLVSAGAFLYFGFEALFADRVRQEFERYGVPQFRVCLLYTSSLAFHATKKSVGRFLGLFQFSELDRATKIRDLSGGQAARVALAQCLLSGAAAIMLDEPTNHLDMQSTQVMERALAHFPGAVLVVSHDRFFIDKVANRVLRFDGEGGASELQAGV